jgi:hypothetical protein
MTHPTPLSPWFVLAQERVLEGDGLEFYTTIEEDVMAPPKFSPIKRNAMIFLNLNTAKRTRDSQPGSFLIVLCSREDLTEFGR